jgi:heptosyltransferase-1
MSRILLIKTSSLGDVVHNLPVVTDICAHTSDAVIDWVVEASFADIPALHPRVRRVIPVSMRRWRKGLLKRDTWRAIGDFRRAVQEEEYDHIIDTQGLLKSVMLAKFARGPIAGHDTRSAREPLAAYGYHQRYRVVRGRHAVLRNRDLAAQAFGYALPTTPPDYGIHAPREPLPDGLREPYVVCLHGTSRPSKQWPIAYWNGFAHELIRRGLTPVLPWGDDAEHQRARAIAAAVPGTIVLPRLPLRRLAVVLGDAKAVVGMDTGLAHLAVALDCPTVALFTDTSPALTGVYPANAQRAINLGDKARVPTPAEALAALGQLGAI